MSQRLLAIEFYRGMLGFQTFQMLGYVAFVCIFRLPYVKSASPVSLPRVLPSVCSGPEDSSKLGKAGMSDLTCEKRSEGGKKSDLL